MLMTPQAIIEQEQHYIIQTYKRFPIVLTHGEGVSKMNCEITYLVHEHSSCKQIRIIDVSQTLMRQICQEMIREEIENFLMISAPL